MGRITQIITYINADKHPGGFDMQHYYTHLGINDSTKAARRKYRDERGLKSEEVKDGGISYEQFKINLANCRQDVL